MDDGSRSRRPRGGRSVARPLLAFACGALVLAFGVFAHAQPSSDVTLDVGVGFDGVFAAGRVTPVAVGIDHEGVPLEAELIVRQTWRPLLEAPRAIEARRAVTLGSKARARYVIHLPVSGEPPPEGEAPQLSVQLRANGQTLDERVVALDGARREQLVLMASESGYLQELPTGEMTLQLSADELPTDWRAYDGVRRLYVGRLDATQLTSDQGTAIRKWVTSGGELVVLSGDNAYRQAADWLTDLVPFRVETVETIDAFGARAALGEPRGDVRYAANDRPLLTEWRVGRGEVSFSALSLTNAGSTQSEIWDRLAAGPTESSGPFTLGAELFRRMPLRYPDKVIVAGLFAGYMVGIGLLMLWALRRTPWQSGGQASGAAATDDAGSTEAVGRNRLWVGMVAWIGLAAALAIGYSGQPAFTKQMQSLELGVTWGSARTELMDAATGFSAIAKRPLDPSWALPPGSAVAPLRTTDVALAEGGATVGPLERTLPPNVTRDLAVATVRPLDVRVELTGDAAVRATQLRVYNEGEFRLRKSIVWHDGNYYGLSSTPIEPGQSRTVDLDAAEPVAPPWMAKATRLSGFAAQAKGALFDDVDRRLRERGDPWALLSWIREPSLSVHRDEHRETWRLLVVTPW